MINSAKGKSISIAIFLVILMGLAACDQTTGSEMEISDIWLRPVALDSPPAMGSMTDTGGSQETMEIDGSSSVTGAAYFLLRNNGSTGDRLESVTNIVDGSGNTVAGSAELHESQMVDGLMSMEMLTDGVPVPAGKSVAFEPGGMHVMLLDLKQDLVAGDRVSLQLNFEHSNARTVAGVVEQR